MEAPSTLSLATFLIAFNIALGLGLLIGLERQWGQHPAGMRTNALVAGGAALFVLFGRTVVGGADEARVAAQIVSGIGFLGAGVILREGLSVRGLTTAATLWCAAAVGALCGASLLREAGIAAAAILATNSVLNPFSRWVDRHAAARCSVYVSYCVKIVCEMAEERRIRHLLSQHIAAQKDIFLHGIGVHATDHPDRGVVVADLDLRGRDQHILQDIVAQLNADPATTSTSWEKRP